MQDGFGTGESMGEKNARGASLLRLLILTREYKLHPGDHSKIAMAYQVES